VGCAARARCEHDGALGKGRREPNRVVAAHEERLISDEFEASVPLRRSWSSAVADSRCGCNCRVGGFACGKRCATTARLERLVLEPTPCAIAPTQRECGARASYHGAVSSLRAPHERPAAPLEPRAFAHVPFDDYRLLDSGQGEKLERFGPVRLRRPDPQALWARRRSDDEWMRADLTFVRESDRGGRWEARRGGHELTRRSPLEWSLSVGGCRFLVRPTPFKHVGIFAEQAANWDLVARSAQRFEVERPRLLNLFGYTGVASITAARAGYDVTHVDASRTSLAWTRDNLHASALADDRLRVVLDDALAFAARESRRSARYHVVLLDPPHYGRGPKGQKWQFEDQIAELVGTVKALLEERALAILSTYAIGCSPLTLGNLMSELGPGEIECGELALPESDEVSVSADGPASRAALLLPAGFCARWSRGLFADAHASNGA
jgi:23S rRNA (cytosine1962-C5)-methyltransferase